MARGTPPRARRPRQVLFCSARRRLGARARACAPCGAASAPPHPFGRARPRPRVCHPRREPHRAAPSFLAGHASSRRQGAARRGAGWPPGGRGARAAPSEKHEVARRACGRRARGRSGRAASEWRSAVLRPSENPHASQLASTVLGGGAGHQRSAVARGAPPPARPALGEAADLGPHSSPERASTASTEWATVVSSCRATTRACMVRARCPARAQFKRFAVPRVGPARPRQLTPASSPAPAARVPLCRRDLQGLRPAGGGQPHVSAAPRPPRRLECDTRRVPSPSARGWGVALWRSRHLRRGSVAAGAAPARV
jgi:hypothetical protein